MNETLKKLFDEFLKELQTGGYNAAVAYIQYFVKQIPPAELDAIVASLSKTDLMKLTLALPLAWKNANELSAAEAKRLWDIFGLILKQLLAIALNQAVTE